MASDVTGSVGEGAGSGEECTKRDAASAGLSAAARETDDRSVEGAESDATQT